MHHFGIISGKRDEYDHISGYYPNLNDEKHEQMLNNAYNWAMGNTDHLCSIGRKYKDGTCVKTGTLDLTNINGLVNPLNNKNNAKENKFVKFDDYPFNYDCLNNDNCDLTKPLTLINQI